MNRTRFMGLFVVAAVLIGGLFIHRIGPRNLIHMYSLQTSGQDVIGIGTGTSGAGRYLTDSNNPASLLKARMENEGWSFVEQEGSGYFFTKDGRKALVTMKQWMHAYHIYNVSTGAADLSG
ncbi:hypothetical protein ACLBWT_01080 [Paenibacillus sp. D51F]